MGVAAAGGFVVGLLVFVWPTPAVSEVIAPFAERFQINDNGAIRIFGNQVLTCPVDPTNPNRCLNARNGTGPNNTLNDNNHVMVNVDADGAAFPTYNSSRDEVNLPEGSTVLWAGSTGAPGCSGARAAPPPQAQVALR
jgi:hypothetical protein